METKKSNELAAQCALLESVFPGSGLSLKYLEWLYCQSPDGQDIPSDYLEDNELLGHYTIVRQRWNSDGDDKMLALSLNTAVHEKARGKGLFTKLAKQCYADAEAQGIRAIIGVANANSTPGFLGKLGFKLVYSLPVVAGLVFPAKASRIESIPVSEEFLRTRDFEQIANKILNGAGAEGYSQKWSTEKLKWRLSSPRSKYALHHDATGTLISTSAPMPMGIPAVVALKFFPHSSQPVDTRSLIRAAAAFHKTPFFVYSGFNAKAPVKGTSLPKKLLPSPLNLIYRRLDEQMDHPDEVKFASFEFLDFDAY